MFRFLFLLLLLPITSFAQRDTIYFDSFGMRVKKGAAKYYRPPYAKEGEKYKVTEYYMEGQRHEEAYSRSFDSLIWDGPYVSYYKNGQKELSGNYINGHKIGTWKKFYEDTNRVWAVSTFNILSDTMEVLRSFYRTGKVKRIEYRVKDKNGKGVTGGTAIAPYNPSGICYNESGEEIPFTPFEKMPEFKMDINKFLGINMRYPDEAREANEDGRVNVQFIVDEEGKVKNPVVVNPHVVRSLMREAVRVIELTSGGWTPGKEDDVPVKVRYTLPVLFRLE